MFSARFGKPVVTTDHARRRMAARGISEALLLDLIETGEVRYKDETRAYISKHYENRADNLLCVAAVLETALVIKTAMHHFSWGLDHENNLLSAGRHPGNRPER